MEKSRTIRISEDRPVSAPSRAANAHPRTATSRSRQPGIEPEGESPGTNHATEATACFGIQIAEPAVAAELSYLVWFREQILPTRGLTFFATFYVHWLLLLLLSGFILQSHSDKEPFLLNAVFTDADLSDDSLEVILDTEFSLPEAMPPEDAPFLKNSALTASTTVTSIEPSSLDVLPEGFKAMALHPPAVNVPEKKPLKAKNIPKHAMTAGSFAVWTEPANPNPGEPYKIIVQIQLPEGTETYSVADLEGVVVGSDGYQKFIPGAARGFLPIENSSVKLEIPIVSADRNVQDTVFVRSKLLREAQRLQIRF